MRFSLSTNILLGFVLGIICGVVFGEYCNFLKVFGDAFIKLLQMTIIPYITVSLIHGIGSLSLAQARKIVLRAGSLLLIFWAIGILFT